MKNISSEPQTLCTLSHGGRRVTPEIHGYTNFKYSVKMTPPKSSLTEWKGQLGELECILTENGTENSTEELEKILSSRIDQVCCEWSISSRNFTRLVARIERFDQQTRYDR